MSSGELVLNRVHSSMNIERERNSFLYSLRERPAALILDAEPSPRKLIFERIMSYLSLERQQSMLILQRVYDTINVPYLEIEPDLIWVYYDLESDNDVISNVDWFID